MTQEEMKTLAKFARLAAHKARCHKSNFRVGATIIDEIGQRFSGANVEFDSHTSCVHAEKNALVNYLMFSKHKALAIAVYTKDNPMWWPCGICLQDLYEYLGDDLLIIECNDENDEAGYPIIEYKYLSELLPHGFRRNGPLWNRK